MNTAYFNLSFGLYILLRTWLLSGGNAPDFIRFYLADLLALPVTLTWTVWLISLIKKRAVKLSFSQILFAILYTTFIMEYLAPRWSFFATGDILDGVMYLVGGLSFYAAQVYYGHLMVSSSMKSGDH